MFTDADILAARPPKQRLDPWMPYDYLLEWERAANGHEEPVATIFLTNKECPFRCTMCDLWKYTLDERAPVGAIPAQIKLALDDLPPANHIKLYNAGNFFDAQAIPPEDHDAIAALVSRFDTVIVENHPKLTDERCVKFRDLLVSSASSGRLNSSFNRVGNAPRESAPHAETRGALPTRLNEGSPLDGPRLEVALGLETIHPDILPRLNKRMTLDDFNRAATFLRKHDIDTRAFILLKPPGLNEREGIDWALKSIAHAFDVGVGCCSVIPTRAGNGIMDRMLSSGEFAPPTLRSMEEVLERGIELAQKAGSPHRVFVDLWNAHDLGQCSRCTSGRVERLHVMNKSQRIDPRMKCVCDVG